MNLYEWIGVGLCLVALCALGVWAEWRWTPPNTYEQRRSETLDSGRLARAFGKPAAKGLSEESKRKHLQKITQIGSRR